MPGRQVHYLHGMCGRVAAVDGEKENGGNGALPTRGADGEVADEVQDGGG